MKCATTNSLNVTLRLSFSDDDICSSLAYVWLSVYRVLEKVPKMQTLLANQEEFQRNVVQKGEQQFINLLRDMAYTFSLFCPRAF